jgi:hypothetical protein
MTIGAMQHNVDSLAIPMLLTPWRICGRQPGSRQRLAGFSLRVEAGQPVKVQVGMGRCSEGVSLGDLVQLNTCRFF